MVASEAHRNHRARPDCAVNDPGPRNDLAEADDSNLWRINDAIKRFDAPVTETGYRNRRIGYLRAANSSGPRTLHKVTHGAHQVVERKLIRIMQSGRSQTAATDGDCDAQMHWFRGFEFVVAIEAVEAGEAVKGQGDCP